LSIQNSLSSSSGSNPLSPSNRPLGGETCPPPFFPPKLRRFLPLGNPSLLSLPSLGATPPEEILASFPLRNLMMPLPPPSANLPELLELSLLSWRLFCEALDTAFSSHVQTHDRVFPLSELSLQIDLPLFFPPSQGFPFPNGTPPPLCELRQPALTPLPFFFSRLQQFFFPFPALPPLPFLIEHDGLT